MVADGWGPLGSETRRCVVIGLAGLCWAEVHRWAGGLCRAAVQDGGGLADFYYCGYGPKCIGPFPIF
jgi:hypothetical protein